MSWRGTGLSSFARRWWVVVVAPVVGAVLASAYASRVDPVYEAKATLVMNAPKGTVSLEAVTAHVPTYAELANSTPLLRAALEQLGLPLTPEELQPDVRGEGDTSTRLLTIRVRGQDPALAAAIANELSRQLIRRAAAAGAPVAGTSRVEGGPRLTLLQPASGGALIRPKLPLMVGFGALAGLFGGLAIAVLVGLSRRTVRREDELSRLVPIPVLGFVNGGLPTDEGGAGSTAAEPYQRLSARILSVNGAGVLRSVLVVGAQGDEGSAAVASKLGLAVSGAMGRVIVMDLANDRPIADVFGIGEDSAGTQTTRSRPLRHGSLTLDRFALRADPRLILLFPRGGDAWSGGLEDARAILVFLQAQADFVVVHAASLGSSSSMLVWARILEAAVLVVRPEKTRRESVVSAVEALGLARTNVVGAVLHTGA